MQLKISIMKMKKYFVIIITLLALNQTNAQIKTLDDFIIKNEELKTLTVRIAKNYIMAGVLPTNKKIAKEFDDDKTKFSDVIVTLTNQSPNEEIEIELQKLNLSWMMLGRILSKKYDGNAASKVLDYSEKMLVEIDGISDMILQSTKLKSVKLLKTSSNGRMLSQKVLLYYIAHRVKIRHKSISDRFDKAKSELYEVIKVLTDQAQSDPVLKQDEGIQLYMDMIKDSYGKVRKTLTMTAKVHPLTANLIVNQLTENFDLLTNMIYEKFNGE